MGETIVATDRLTKRYGARIALDACTLRMERGQVVALVGKNGGGKTTLMRLISGHSIPTSGALSLFGQSRPRKLLEARTRVGAVIEEPALYPYLCAHRNLRQACIARGLPVTAHLDELLRFVGLQDVGKLPCARFSKDMRYRLALALALIAEPELLLLDEPTGGLDPVGIARIREIILNLNRERGVTVLVTSHILSELTAVATHYAFLDQGRLIERLSAAELNSHCQSALVLRVNDTERACAVLENLCGCRHYQILPKNIIKCYDRTGDSAQINRELMDSGVAVYEIARRGMNLESYFMSLLGGTAHA